MAKLNINFDYVNLEKAGAMLGVSSNDLIHAGAFDQVQVCVNIYSRATSMRRIRIDENPDFDERDLNDAELAESVAEKKRYDDWLERLRTNMMPAGIFEIGTEDLRLFEMPEIVDLDLSEGYKADELGLFIVEFDIPVNITRADLVILTSELVRIQRDDGVETLSARERRSLINIVAAMLDQLITRGANQTGVIIQAIEDHGHMEGISKRKLEEVFAAANRSLKKLIPHLR